MGGLKPDYRTIARFRITHKEAIRKVLKQCVHMCMKLDLIEGNVLFIDGSKFRADASINNTWPKDKCTKYMKKIEEHIDQLMEEMEKIDTQEQQEESLVKIKEQIHNKTKLINKIKGVLTDLETQDKKSLNSTDPESVKAKTRQGTHAVYNVQSTVDGKHGLIVNSECVSQNNDSNQLSRQVKLASDVIGHKPAHVCADAGYANIEEFKKIDQEINVVVPSRKQAQKSNDRHPVNRFDKEHFSYDALQNEYICPAGNRLKYAGLNRKTRKYYQCPTAVCRRCSNFGNPQSGQCTRAVRGRKIYRLIDQELQEQMEANYAKPENQKIYALRKQKVEHPFGHLKRNLGVGQFMLRGKEKVEAEFSVLATCFNIARLITIIGIPKLLTSCLRDSGAE
jgi:hypothetical protein